jgi:hypothetical protein
LNRIAIDEVRSKLMFLDCLRLNAATRHQVTAQGNALGQVKPKISPKDFRAERKPILGAF